MENKKFNTNLIILIIALLVAGYLFYGSDLLPSIGGSEDEQGSSIVTFDDCVGAGNPVMKSFPEQCITSDGVHFTNWRGTDQSCIQVITPAQNPETEEVREFPTPCDVPVGWIHEQGIPISSED